MNYDRPFWGESSFRAAYVRKMVRDEFATYNVLREGQFTVSRQIPVVMRSFDGGIEGTRTFTLFDIPDALRGQVRNVIANNTNAVTNFNLTNGANFNRINATLDPRTFMVGLRFDF